MKAARVHFAVLGVLLVSASLTSGQEIGTRVERSVMVPMRDGVVLSTDLYFPDGAEGPLPAILIRRNASNYRITE